MQGRKVGSRNKNYPKRITKICLQCNKEFVTTLSRKDKQFCSNNCHYKYKPERIIQSKKRRDTILKRYGSFKYTDMYGEEVAKEFSNKLSKIQLELAKNRSHVDREKRAKKISKTLTGHIVTDETKFKLSMNSGSKRPEVKEKISKSMKLLWKTEEYSKNQLSKILHGVCSRPNNFEANAILFLNNSYPNMFEYTGNGCLILDGKSADAYSKELNTIALFHGSYWHLTHNGLQINAQNRRDVEIRDSNHFLKLGYNVFIIWDDEMILKEYKLN